MPAILSKILTDTEHWMRLGLFLHEPLKEAVLHVFHNPRFGGLPTNPNDLYEELEQNHKQKLNKLRKDRVLSDEQFHLILPSDKQTDSSKFDITLLAVLIRNCLNLPPPLKGWKCNNPPINDQSIAAYIIRAREWRNFFHHTEPSDITKQIFDNQWQLGVDIITAFGFVYDTESLKNTVLDPMRFSITQTLMVYLDNEQKKMKQTIQQNSDTITELNPLFEQTDILNNQVQILKQFVEKNKDLRDVVEDVQSRINVIFNAHDLMENKIAEHIKFCQENLQFEQSNITEDSSKFVLTDVLLRTSRLLGPQWETVAKHIGVSTEYILEITEGLELSERHRMDLCFKKLNNTITWKALKSGLQIANRLDIIEHLQDYTLLTYGLRNAYMQLQRIYIEDLLNWILVQPFMGHDGFSCDNVSREEAYVDLAIITASEMDKYWSNSDREFHLQQRHFERTGIMMKDILTNKDNFVLARGIAGIGKSTLVDTFVLKWAKGDIMTGVDGSAKIDFLFKFTCRELNTFSNIKSAEELLRIKYSEVFKYIDVEDLEEISHRVLILLDGADELKSFQDIKAHKPIEDDLVRSVIDLINPKSNLLRGHKTLVAGRPEACRIVTSSMRRFVDLKTIEVCGFSPKNVDLYIERFFGKDSHLTDKVKDKIIESENLCAMASIPVYLWVICGIFKEDIYIEAPKTTTHLSAYACLIFLRNHLKLHQSTFQDVSMSDLCRDEQIIKIISCLSQLSEITMAEKKVVFLETIVSALNSPIQLEKTGFLVKHVYGERGSFYQFRHLVLQEFFTALNLYLCSEDIEKDMEKPCFSSCIPVVAGLTGIEVSTSDDFIKDLLFNLREYKFSECGVKKVNASNGVCRYLTNCFSKQILTEQSLLIDATCCCGILSAFYEYHETLSDIPRISSIQIKNISHHHDIRNLLYLVDKLAITDIKQLSIINTGNKPLAKNFWELIKLHLKLRSEQFRFKTELLLQCEAVMSVRTVTQSLTHSKKEKLIVALTKEFQKHKQFLTQIIPFVDQIAIHISLDSKYVEIKNMIQNYSNEVFKNKVMFEDVSSAFNKQEVHLTEYHMMMLADALDLMIKKGKKSPYKELHLVGIGLLDDHVKVLKPMLYQLKLVNLSWNKSLSPAAMISISESVRNGYSRYGLCQLQVLKLVNCDLQDSHIYALRSMISILNELDISWNQSISSNAMINISNEVIRKKFQPLRENAAISLKLANCKLTDEHIQVLCPCICYMKELDISMNENLSPMIMSLLSLSSPTNDSHLQWLDLRCCNITDQHIAYLSGSLVKLTQLRLDGNVRLTKYAMKTISDVILQFVYSGQKLTLKTLTLKYISMTNAHLQMLLPSMKFIFDLQY